jgi:DNA-binding transcriptional LysR family regulator
LTVIDKVLKEIELAFLPASIDYSQYDALFCFSWKYCLIINKKHPLVQKKIINYTELDGVPLALKGRSYSVFPSNISRFLKEGVNSNILLETTSDMLINQVAKANAGVGVSLSFIAERFNSSDTVIRNFDDENCTKEVYLISKKGITKSKESICFSSYLSEWLLTEQHFSEHCYIENIPQIGYYKIKLDTTNKCSLKRSEVYEHYSYNYRTQD